MALPALILPILSAVAPALIGRVFGEDEGADKVARSVRAVVKEVTGIEVTTEAERDEALAAIAEDVALRAELKARLADIALRETEMLLADRADARNRDIELARLTGSGNDRATNMLIAAFAGVTVIVLALIGLNYYAELGSDRYVGTIIGFLTGIGGMFARNIGTAFDFEFGSSRGSQRKSGQIADLSARLEAMNEARGPLAEFRGSMGALKGV